MTPRPLFSIGIPRILGYVLCCEDVVPGVQIRIGEIFDLPTVVTYMFPTPVPASTDGRLFSRCSTPARSLPGHCLPDVPPNWTLLRRRTRRPTPLNRPLIGMLTPPYQNFNCWQRKNLYPCSFHEYGNATMFRINIAKLNQFRTQAFNE